MITRYFKINYFNERNSKAIEIDGDITLVKKFIPTISWKKFICFYQAEFKSKIKHVFATDSANLQSEWYLAEHGYVLFIPIW